MIKILVGVVATLAIMCAVTAKADIAPVGPFELAQPPVAAQHCTMFVLKGDDRIWGVVDGQHVAGNTVMRAWEAAHPATPTSPAYGGRKIKFNSDNSSFGPCAGYDSVFRAFGVSSHP